MNYTVTSDQNTHFELLNDGVLMGSMDYHGMFPVGVTLTVGNDQFKLGPANIWGTTYQVVNGEDVLVEMMMSWPGNHVIHINGRSYSFNRNFWSFKFTLFNEDEQPIAIVIPDYGWTSFRFTYDIETDDQYPDANNVLLLLSAVYCCNHLKKRMAMERV